MIHEYKTGRFVCGLFEVLAWIGVFIAAIGLLAALTAATKGGGLGVVIGSAAAIPMAELLFFCFLVIIAAQMARAGMDSSVAAQKNVIQAQKQHEESMRSLRDLARNGNPAGYAATAQPAPAKEDAPVRPSAAVARLTEPADGYDGIGHRHGAPQGQAIDARAFDDMRRLPDTREVGYRDHMILETRHGGYLRDRKFDSVEEAKLFVDHMLDNVAVKVMPEQPSSIEYKGHRIEIDGNKCRIGGLSFNAIDRAKRHIDHLVDKPDAEAAPYVLRATRP